MTNNTALSAREIAEGMTKGEWKVAKRIHLLAYSVETGEAIASFGVRTSNVQDLLPQQTADLNAACTAVNGTYGKGLNPAQYENLVHAATEALKHANNNGHFYIEELLRTALELAKLK